MQITREEADRLVQLKGEARGGPFLTDAKYVKSLAGDEGMARVTAAARELGHPIDYDTLKEMAWYPVGLRVLSLLIIQQEFELDDVAIMAMADTGTKRSLIIKMMMRFFMSARAIVEQFPKLWEKYYTVGTMSVIDFDDAARRVAIRLTGFDCHPVQCRYLEGYLLRMLRFVFPDAEVNIHEEKCTFRGDAYHEYRVTW